MEDSDGESDIVGDVDCVPEETADGVRPDSEALGDSDAVPATDQGPGTPGRHKIGTARRQPIVAHASFNCYCARA